MAATSATAKRYATAAFTVAGESNAYDEWSATLDELARIMRMPSARVVFTSPTVAASDKRAALERLLPNVSPNVRSFLNILAERDRLDEVQGVAQALHDLINKQRGIVTAEVTTAVPLDAQLEGIVAQRLATYLRREPSQITVRSRVDPGIIGGVVARIGDQLIDDSVRGRLERLRRALTSP